MKEVLPRTGFQLELDGRSLKIEEVVTRAVMLLRANCLAKGNSGVRLELVERLLFYLNNDILPLMPERGSCGASGDLVPLSYLGAALVGEEKVLHDGEVKSSREALNELGLE